MNWDLPTRCPQCRKDLPLIRGAIGAMRDHFKFAIEGRIVQRGFFFTEKVVEIRSKKTGELVAEIRMDTGGFLRD
jgi:hypothetical protein